MYSLHVQCSVSQMDVQAAFETDPKLSHAPMVQCCVLSNIENSHRRPVYDIQWMPPQLEVSSCVCVCACVLACVCACVRACVCDVCVCVRACVRVCAMCLCVCVYVSTYVRTCISCSNRHACVACVCVCTLLLALGPYVRICVASNLSACV